MSTQELFLKEVEAFLVRSGMAPTRLGSLATGDPSLVANLREGRDLRASTMDKVRQCMRDHEGEEQPKRGRRPLERCA
jgi:predicted transcriptional regulator